MDNNYYGISFFRTQEFKFSVKVFFGFLLITILFSTICLMINESTKTTNMNSVVTDASDVSSPDNLTIKIIAEHGNIVQKKHDNITSKGMRFEKLTGYENAKSGERTQSSDTDKTSISMAYKPSGMDNIKTVTSVKYLPDEKSVELVEGMEIDKQTTDTKIDMFQPQVKKKKLAKYKAGEIKAVKNIRYILKSGISAKYIMKNKSVKHIEGMTTEKIYKYLEGMTTEKTAITDTPLEEEKINFYRLVG